MATDYQSRQATAAENAVVALPCAHGLTDREREVIGLAGGGATDKEIADRLDVNVAALRTHWTRIREKLGAVNRTHAIALATVESPATPSNDLRSRLIDSLFGDKVALWVWQGRSRQALLDRSATRLFSIPTTEEPVSFDRIRSHIWAPDRPRLERFLLQCTDLRPMTPIEFRVGTPGDYRTLIRTVNLASDNASDPSLLLASTTIHVFPP